MRKFIGAALTAAVVAAGFSAAPAGATKTFGFTRLSGADRYGTAAAIATTTFTSAADVVVATGEAFPDALAGNYLAGQLAGPVLLTQRTTLPTTTRNALQSLGAKRVTLLGQTSAIDNSVASDLTNAGYAVTRIGGSDRYDTARQIATSRAGDQVGIVDGRRTALLATGENFPDAISGGPAAWALKLPVLLTRPSSLSAEASSAIDTLGITGVVLLGGTQAVSDTVVSQLQAKGVTVTRVAGADRYETAAKLADWAVGRGFTNGHVNVATGLAFPDALAGGPHGGKEKAATLLVGGDVPAATSAWLQANASTLADGHLFGGEQAIPSALAAAMASAAGNTSGGGTVSGTGTTRPELTSTRIVSTTAGVSTTMRYCFDEPVIAANNALFHVYDATGPASVQNGSSSSVFASDNKCLDVVFTGITTSTAASSYTVATVDIGAVQDVTGDLNPEGDAPLSSSSTSFVAGRTSAPDLTSASLGTAGVSTNVTFTFDEKADHAAGAFQVVKSDNSVVTCAYSSGDGTTAIVASCPDTLNSTNTSRAVVLSGTVIADDDGTPNVLETHHFSKAPTGPSLTSAVLTLNIERTGGNVDRVMYTFDQLVNDPAANTALFQVYTSAAQENTCAALGCTLIRNDQDAKQVAAEFPAGTLTNAVGASVLGGAVTGFQSALPNQVDEAAMTNSTTTSTSSGRTVGPDLVSVAIVAHKDGFGNIDGYDAAYTFDERVDAVNSLGKLKLWLADGTEMTCTAADVGSVGLGTQDIVTCTTFTLPDASVKVATLGTVDDGAVNAYDGGPDNVEGASGTTHSGF